MEQIIELTLIPFALLIVQAIKIVLPESSKYAIPMVLVIGVVLATLLVDWSQSWQLAMIALFSATVQIASGASGVYSWGKKSGDIVDLEDYSDEQ